MERLNRTDGGDVLEIWRVPGNIINKQK